MQQPPVLVRVPRVDVAVEPDADRPPLASAPPSFDEWVTVRAPSLLRFAHVVTGSQHAAEDAVQAALAERCGNGLPGVLRSFIGMLG